MVNQPDTQTDEMLNARQDKDLNYESEGCC